MYLTILTLLSLLASRLVANPVDVQPGRPRSPPGPSRQTICFEQRYAHRSLHQIASSDCVEATDQVLASDKVEAPMLFGRKTGYILPHGLNAGTCGIMLDINDKTSDKTVTLPMAVIVRAVHLILEECVSDFPPPGWGPGGFTEIHSPDGSGGILDVVVLGHYPPPEDPPPFPQGRTFMRTG